MSDDATPGVTPPGQQQPPPAAPGYGQAPPPPGVPPGYGQAPPWQAYPGYYLPPPGPPKHPKATTSLILGIIGLGGVMLCFFPILVAPFAWVTGAKALREIDADPQSYGGRSEANAGKIMGIVGTVLLIVLILAAVLLFGTLWLTSTAHNFQGVVGGAF